MLASSFNEHMMTEDLYKDAGCRGCARATVAIACYGVGHESKRDMDTKAYNVMRYLRAMPCTRIVAKLKRTFVEEWANYASLSIEGSDGTIFRDDKS
jgi:hypothetical protein